MNKNNLFLRKTLVSLAILSIMVMMVAPSSAANDELSSWTGTPMTILGGAPAFHTETAEEKMGVSVMGDGSYLTSFSFKITSAVNVSSGVLRGSLWLSVGTNKTRVSNSSNTWTATIVSDQWSNVTFYWGGTDKLLSGFTYYVVAEVVTATAQTSYFASTDGAGGSWCVYYTSPSWGTDADKVVYSVYSTDTYEDTTGIGGTGGIGIDYNNYDQIITAFVSFMVPLIITLLPFLLLALITRRVDKWVLLIGITIGASLGFYFGLVPLWLVFLITIGLIGMAYQSVRGGG